MDALRNGNGDGHKEEALTHSPPPPAVFVENNLSAVVEEELIEKVVVDMQPESEEVDVELDMTPMLKFVLGEEEQEVRRNKGKAVIDESDYVVYDDELSEEEVKLIAECENEYSSDDNDDEDEQPPKKKLQLSSLGPSGQVGEESSAAAGLAVSAEKKNKKKYSFPWARPLPKRGKKKPRPGLAEVAAASWSFPGSVRITPLPKLPETPDDSPLNTICLSKVQKAEKVEVSDDRMSAGSIKGYRMVRATRGVTEGAWYFEIKVVHLGESGHTRLGWSTDKGDLQAPVGFDVYSYAYRDIDGEKVHKAVREKYGEGYGEGDIIGFYINLPNGESYAPNQPRVVFYRGQKYLCDPEEKHAIPQVVPGSCVSFFKNGIWQGIAYKDLMGGRYYPAASMYTLPNQQNCEVKFNFGPDFECFPSDFGDCPVPKPMVEVPYHGYDDSAVKGNDTAA